MREVARSEYILLGEALRRLREKAGLSQRALGERIGKDHTFVTRVETAQQTIDFGMLLDFAKHTGGKAWEVVREIEEQRAANDR